MTKKYSHHFDFHDIDGFKSLTGIPGVGRIKLYVSGVYDIMFSLY